MLRTLPRKSAVWIGLFCSAADSRMRRRPDARGADNGEYAPHGPGTFTAARVRRGALRAELQLFASVDLTSRSPTREGALVTN